MPLSRCARWIPLLAVALCTAGCDRPPRLAQATPPRDTVRIVADTLYAAEQLAIPTRVAVVGPHLVVLDIGGDSAVRVLRREDGAVVRTFGRKGRGPGEFNAPWSIDAEGGSGDRFWVYDMDLARLTRVDLSGPFDAPARNRWPVVSLVTAGHFNSPVWTSDDRILSPGVFSTGSRFAELDADGRLLRFTGPPPGGAPTTPMMVRQHAYLSKSSFNHDRKLVVLATDHADRVEVYRPDGTLVRGWHGPAGFEPVYRVARVGGIPVFEGGDELRFGYVDVSTTRGHIFVLYSGRTRKEYGGASGYGKEVHVYSWDGRLERVLALDAAAISLAVSPDERFLYAAVVEPTPTILRYRLP